MENKYMKYGLMGLAVVVWGAIIYRVIGGFSSSGDPVMVAVKLPALAPTPVQDSFILYADYPDPFIPEKDSIDMIDTKRPAGGSQSPGFAPPVIGNAAYNAPAPGPAKPVMTALQTLQSFCQYTGMVGNPEKNTKVALINLHGKDLLIHEKEKREEIIVKKIEKEMVVVVYKGKSFEIYKSN